MLRRAQQRWHLVATFDFHTLLEPMQGSYLDCLIAAIGQPSAAPARHDSFNSVIITARCDKHYRFPATAMLSDQVPHVSTAWWSVGS